MWLVVGEFKAGSTVYLKGFKVRQAIVNKRNLMLESAVSRSHP